MPRSEVEQGTYGWDPSSGRIIHNYQTNNYQDSFHKIKHKTFSYFIYHSSMNIMIPLKKVDYNYIDIQKTYNIHYFIVKIAASTLGRIYHNSINQQIV